MASAPRTPTRKAQSFINANEASPLVYQSYDEKTGITTFRQHGRGASKLALVAEWNRYSDAPRR
jgi:hypothetical protein